MRKIRLILALAIIGQISCEDSLESVPGDAYSDAVIYSDIEAIDNLVFYTYNTTENWGLNFSNWWTRRIGIEGASDEAYFHWASNTLFTSNYSTTDSNNFGFYVDIWSRDYDYIGTANNFLSRIDEAPVGESNPDEIAVLKGEMKYLRAHTYARLINFFGGVPLITEPFSLNDESFSVPRSSYEECVDFIVSELDEAISLLPDGARTGPEFGRVSKAAALGLKSRVLLYAASAQHDPGSTASPRGAMYDYTKPSKWQDASDAAKELIDLGEYTLEPVSTADDYHSIFLRPNSELIFARPFSPDFANAGNDFNTLPDKAHGAVANGGWGLSNPTHNFIQRIKMNNGLRIDEPGSGYDENDLYANRELRFYANFNYQGSSFKGLELEYWSPFGNSSKDLPGNDGRHFAITGYNVKKFLDPNITIDVEQSPNRPYPLIRFPEILLNYAEAQYHLGNEGEARLYASMVAERVGLPAITSSGDALLDDIKYERSMELYFEGHRYFDLRRWMDSRLGEDVVGVQWEKQNASGELDANGTLVMLGPNLIDDRTFNIEDYYLPIPFNEIERAGLEQNQGY
ncbi:RagB/SusD family nutrient uptake outer membrane protein [Flagellimonas sp.]|uniref:RagB/SusD family nutrient uptake outer membrane protein n=1 Tax=Flagellimonas sp. TaxID=2058762 RepID=UPI003B520D66